MFTNLQTFFFSHLVWKLQTKQTLKKCVLFCFQACVSESDRSTERGPLNIIKKIINKIHNLYLIFNLSSVVRLRRYIGLIFTKSGQKNVVKIKESNPLPVRR